MFRYLERLKVHCCNLGELTLSNLPRDPVINYYGWIVCNPIKISLLSLWMLCEPTLSFLMCSITTCWMHSVCFPLTCADCTELNASAAQTCTNVFCSEIIWSVWNNLVLETFTIYWNTSNNVTSCRNEFHLRVCFVVWFSFMVSVL